MTQEQDAWEFYSKRQEKYTPKDENETRDKAERLLGKEGLLNKLFRSQKALLALAEDCKTSLSLIKDWFTDAYNVVPWRTIASLCGALVYVISPADLIPDFIPFIGYVDDAAVFAFVLKCVHDDIQRYKAWKSSK